MLLLAATGRKGSHLPKETAYTDQGVNRAEPHSPERVSGLCSSNGQDLRNCAVASEPNTRRRIPGLSYPSRVPAKVVPDSQGGALGMIWNPDPSTCSHLFRAPDRYRSPVLVSSLRQRQRGLRRPDTRAEAHASALHKGVQKSLDLPSIAQASDSHSIKAGSVSDVERQGLSVNWILGFRCALHVQEPESHDPKRDPNVREGAISLESWNVATF